jgi:two-component system nitrate/nitrite sensor histidine kinase NarX
MRAHRQSLTLGAKLALAGVPFLLAALLMTLSTLWLSHQLEGGAGAVNEAGRLRMLSWRLVVERGQDPAAPAPAADEFRRSLQLLHTGDPQRPLLVPWDAQVRQRLALVEAAWRDVDTTGSAGAQTDSTMPQRAHALVARIDGLVEAIEGRLSRLTALLHVLQVALLAMGGLAATILVVSGWRFVLRPVAELERAVGRLRMGDLSARAVVDTRDELGALGTGFNDMARQLEASYRELESRVEDKTSELREQRERLRWLYDVSRLVAESVHLQPMAQAFTERLHKRLQGGRVTLSLLQADGQRRVPVACLGATGEPQGRTTEVAVRHQDRLLAEIALELQSPLDDAELASIQAAAALLASGIENLRLQARNKEAAVSEERAFLARELHDSIAQSLAFLGIQAQLMREAMADDDRRAMDRTMGEIEAGLRESQVDVRELLLNFRLRTQAEDIEPALQAALRKFEHRSGVGASLTVHDEGLPLPADVQVQVLHIVQEALANVRKHAQADHVWIDVWKHPQWCIQVRDDGRGFDPRDVGISQVGLRIMRERAQAVGGRLDLSSERRAGTRVLLELPVPGTKALLDIGTRR